MMACIHLQMPATSNFHRKHHRKPTLPPPQCALTKQTDRFLTSLATAAATVDGDSTAANRVIRKFVASSGKSTALDALSLLLSPTCTHPQLSFLALPLYTKITESAWFNWNAKLVAELIALLEKQGRFVEAEALHSDTVLKLGFHERDVASFYCNLIDSQSKHKLKGKVLDSYALLTQLLSNSSSVYLKRQSYEAIIKAFCVMDMPEEAEKCMEEMRGMGMKVSVFEIRSIVYGYGRLGLFNDMQRNIALMENQSFAVDTVCSNMVLSSYGAYNDLPQMVAWLKKMKTSNIPFSVRTYNSVLNSCPIVMSLVQEIKTLPLSIHELNKVIPEEEDLVVRELVGSSVLGDAMEWGDKEAKLDLHGMHLGTAYLIMLQWMDELRLRFHKEEKQKCAVPGIITVVCGSGKHSSVRGESPVKGMVKEIMIRTASVMKVDRKNIGCFVAKGQNVKDWLSK